MQKPKFLFNLPSSVAVHLVRPMHLRQGLPAPEDIGLAMVLAFEGTISRGKRPEVGVTWGKQCASCPSTAL